MNFRVLPKPVAWAMLRFYLVCVGGGVVFGGIVLLFGGNEARFGIATVSFVVWMIVGVIIAGHLLATVLFADGPRWAIPVVALTLALCPALSYFAFGAWGVLALALAFPLAMPVFVQWTPPQSAR